MTPRASGDKVGPWQGGVLQIRVARPPADGEANRAVLGLVARVLAVAPSTLTLVAGERSRLKRIEVRGLPPADLDARLAALGD